jgi:hypothetical protein
MEEAVRALGEAVRALHDSGATHYEAQALVTLTDIAERSGAPKDEVRESLSRALRIHEEGGSLLVGELRRRLADLDR